MLTNYEKEISKAYLNAKKLAKQRRKHRVLAARKVIAEHKGAYELAAKLYKETQLAYTEAKKLYTAELNSAKEEYNLTLTNKAKALGLM